MLVGLAAKLQECGAAATARRSALRLPPADARDDQAGTTAGVGGGPTLLMPYAAAALASPRKPGRHLGRQMDETRYAASARLPGSIPVDHATHSASTKRRRQPAHDQLPRRTRNRRGAARPASGPAGGQLGESGRTERSRLFMARGTSAHRSAAFWPRPDRSPRVIPLLTATGVGPETEREDDAALSIGLAELAVADDVDAGIGLAADHVGDVALELARAGRFVVWLAALHRQLEAHQLRRPDQAADVRRPDFLHVLSFDQTRAPLAGAGGA
jgi:hypothetical protein